MASETLTQEAIWGVTFDFNYGCRIMLPRYEGKAKRKLKLKNLDANQLLFETEFTEKVNWITSFKRYYIRFLIELYEDDELKWSHDYDCGDRPVLVKITGCLGDTLSWIPYVEAFRVKHECDLCLSMNKELIPLFAEKYPGISFGTEEEWSAVEGHFYATYSVGLFLDDPDLQSQPCDFRLIGLAQQAAYILGVDPVETKPRVVIAPGGRPIEEKYVCISVQSTAGCKLWNNYSGWFEITKQLKERGYRVFCIDKDTYFGCGVHYGHIPHGCEDLTGNRPLDVRALWLAHADLYVGLSSGLSWLAWAVDTPVVMISGFTHPINEFKTPYRVINWSVCNSCWNDKDYVFNRDDWDWCPRHKGTSRAFECSRAITVAQVMHHIDKALDDHKA